MENISQEMIDNLTPLEKEAAEWCYGGFMDWLASEKKEKPKEENRVTVAHLLFMEVFNFKAGELESFQALKDKGIIFDLTPLEEKGTDFHEIVVDDTIVTVHRFLGSSK